MHRNLIYNKDFTVEKNSNSEYYLHVITKNIHKKELNQFIGNFLNIRKNKNIENDDLVVVNKTNIKEFDLENEDTDYYFSFSGCLFCKGCYKSFPALYIHMKFCHPDFECYYTVNLFKTLFINI